MAIPLNPPLTPCGGVALRVLLVCRISTVHQDPRSLEDQEALRRRYVADPFGGPAPCDVIATQGSGEVLDRRGRVEIEDRMRLGPTTWSCWRTWPAAAGASTPSRSASDARTATPA